MTRKYYLTEIDKIDYAFSYKNLDTIQFEFMKPDPIIDTVITMDIDTILKLRDTIEVMLKLRHKKLMRQKNCLMKKDL